MDRNIRVIPISKFPVWEKARNNRRLLSITMELTARCNNNCTHCYINRPACDNESINEELSTGKIKSLIDESASMGTLWFLISGGEPLLRDDFEEIYLYLKKKGLLVSLFTNASLVTDDHINLLKKYPPRSVEVTVYGITQKTHRKVTRKNFFSATMNGIEKLIAARLPITLKATIMRSNYEELEEISSYCRRKVSTPFRFDPFLHLRIDGDREKNEAIRTERLTPDEIVHLELNDIHRREVLATVCNAPRSNGESSTDKLFKCRAGIDSCCIGYDGTFKLCSSMSASSCTYDLKTGSLSDAWYKFAPNIRNMTSNKASFSENCGGCYSTDLCMWCPAHAVLETGELDGFVPYFCDVAKKRKESLQSDM